MSKSSQQMKDESLFFCVVALIVLIFGVGFIFGRVQATRTLHKEAIDRGYGTYDNEGGKSSEVIFKWKEKND